MPPTFTGAHCLNLPSHANILKTHPKIAQTHQRQRVVTADTISAHEQLLTVGQAGLFVPHFLASCVLWPCPHD